MDWMGEERENSRMTLKVLVCITGWMVVPLTKMGKTGGIGTGLREGIKDSVSAM